MDRWLWRVRCRSRQLAVGCLPSGAFNPSPLLPSGAFTPSGRLALRAFLHRLPGLRLASHPLLLLRSSRPRPVLPRPSRLLPGLLLFLASGCRLLDPLPSFASPAPSFVQLCPSHPRLRPLHPRLRPSHPRCRPSHPRCRPSHPRRPSSRPRCPFHRRPWPHPSWHRTARRPFWRRRRPPASLAASFPPRRGWSSPPCACLAFFSASPDSF